MNIQVKEENGYLTVDCLTKIMNLMGTFLSPFLQAECYSSRQSRRNYMQDFKKYLEVVKLHHEMVIRVWVGTANYVGELLNIDGRRIINDAGYHYQTHGNFSFFSSYFPHSFEIEFPYKKTITKDMYLQIHTDSQIIDEEGELLKNNAVLLKDVVLVSILVVRVLDRIYIQYGYEFEELDSLFKTVWSLIIRRDKECVQVLRAFNDNLMKTSNKVFEAVNAAVPK